MKKEVKNNNEVVEENDDSILDIMPPKIQEGTIKGSLGDIDEQPLPDPDE